MPAPCRFATRQHLLSTDRATQVYPLRMAAAAQRQATAHYDQLIEAFQRGASQDKTVLRSWDTSGVLSMVFFKHLCRYIQENVKGFRTLENA